MMTTPICRRTPWLAVQPLIERLNSDVVTTIEQLAADASAEIPDQLADAADRWWRDGFPDRSRCGLGRWRRRAGCTLGDPWLLCQRRVAGTAIGTDAAGTTAEELPDTGHGIGQWATLGSNFSINAALIVDIGESARTMVVMGDYFKTDAIFQTNTIVDA